MARPKGQDRYINFPISILATEDIRGMAYMALQYSVGRRIKGCSQVQWQEAVREALTYFQLPLSGEQWWFDTSPQIYLCKCYDRVMTGAKTNQLMVFAKGQETRHDEAMKFRAYLAIKSIIGRGAYKRTSIAHVVARMFGMTDKELSECTDKNKTRWTRRRQFAKLTKGLTNDYHLAYYVPKGCRGFFVSFVLSYEALKQECTYAIRKKASDKTTEIGNIGEALHKNLKHLGG